MERELSYRGRGTVLVSSEAATAVSENESQKESTVMESQHTKSDTSACTHRISIG